VKNARLAEVRVDVDPELLERLQEALEDETEFPAERDLLAYALLLGFHLEALKCRMKDLAEVGTALQDIYDGLYAELSRVQAAHARTSFALAETARDYQTGRLANQSLRREVGVMKYHLIPRLEEERNRLEERRDVLRRALEEL
jgi:hypothetical protein